MRARDFDAGRELFDPDVVSFGTVAAMVEGRRELETEQWAATWACTAEFDFDYARAASFQVGGGVCVAAPWSSLGLRDNGPPFQRLGRATLLLLPGGDGLIAAHSHFSLMP